jgi:hypothetical protein
MVFDASWENPRASTELSGLLAPSVALVTHGSQSRRASSVRARSDADELARADDPAADAISRSGALASARVRADAKSRAIVESTMGAGAARWASGAAAFESDEPQNKQLFSGDHGVHREAAAVPAANVTIATTSTPRRPSRRG